MAMAGTSDCGGGNVLNAKWDGRDTFTVPEAAEILRVSRWSAYEAAKKGEIPTIWIGRRCLVPRRALERMLEVGVIACTLVRGKRSK
jgi:excisionase family DNA binding protein